MGTVSQDDFGDLINSSSHSPLDVLAVVTENPPQKESFSNTNDMNEQQHVTSEVPKNPEYMKYPQLPTKVKEKINKLGDNNPRLIIQKKLTKCDVDPDHSRVTMPEGESRIKLTKEEESKLKCRDNNGNVKGFRVMVIEPSLRLRLVPFKCWTYAKSRSYVLVKPWNDIVAYNGLKEGDTIQLWSFRVKEINSFLGFALVKVDDSLVSQCCSSSSNKRRRSR